jgi:uncharacterized cupin superfamily protein
MLATTIALLEPNGPQGKLERRASTPPEKLEGGEPPIHNGYRWIDDTEHGISMSVWDSTPFTTKTLPFFQHEFMTVLDGSVTVVEPGDQESTFRAGDCFIFPRGCVRQWRQTEYFRKFAVGFRDSSWQEPADPAALRVVRLDLNGPLEATAGPPPVTLLSPRPTQHEHQWFADPTRQMTVSVWDTTACHCKPRAAQAHEWMHVLAGSVTLTDAAGVIYHFKKGDTFVVSLGTVYGWQCPGYFRAIRCAFQPCAAAAKAPAAE